MEKIECHMYKMQFPPHITWTPKPYNTPAGFIDLSFLIIDLSKNFPWTFPSCAIKHTKIVCKLCALSPLLFFGSPPSKGHSKEKFVTIQAI